MWGLIKEKVMNEVYWITGLAGAGKTTIGKALYIQLKQQYSNVIFLDGDILRSIFDNTYGYTIEERKKLAMSYARMCKMLSEQGMKVICCTISMFDEVREWNRENIPYYKEIYIRVPLEILKVRNQKGLYSNLEPQKEVVGVNIVMEEPKNPDLVIDNYNNLTVEECVRMIINFNHKEFYADKRYWDNYYNSEIVCTSPSHFAKCISEQLEEGKSLVDLGCGNGRDSLFFAHRGVKVIGIDGSEVAIRKLIREENKKIEFICDDFVNSESIYSRKHDYFYSRFSIHAIKEEQQHILLKNIYNSLNEDGKVFIEVRGIYDTLYGKGIEVERNAFIYNNHYRRFVVRQELVNELIDIGFEIVYEEENKGFAPFEGEDPILIRIIASKNK